MSEIQSNHIDSGIDISGGPVESYRSITERLHRSAGAACPDLSDQTVAQQVWNYTPDPYRPASDFAPGTPSGPSSGQDAEKLYSGSVNAGGQGYELQ